MHYWMQTNCGALLHSSMLPTDNTSHQGGHPIKGVRPSPYTVVPNSYAGIIISTTSTDGLTV